jgi:hypothetical protein
LWFPDGRILLPGNIFASYVIKGELKASTVKNGIEYMGWLTEWYRANSSGKGVEFFQIGGGIAGDFPICVVPMMYQDLRVARCAVLELVLRMMHSIILMVLIQEPCPTKRSLSG